MPLLPALRAACYLSAWAVPWMGYEICLWMAARHAGPVRDLLRETAGIWPVGGPLAAIAVAQVPLVLLFGVSVWNAVRGLRYASA